jgi:hypothetical protein
VDPYSRYSGQWTPHANEPRFFGLTAAQFDVAVLGLIVTTALSVWLFVFNGTTTAREFLGLDQSPPTAIVAPPSALATPQPVAEPAAAPAAEVAPPAEAALPVEAAPAAPPAAVLSPEQQVVLASAEALAGVQSFRGRFQVSMTADGQSVNSGGDIVFQAPDGMHMTMNMGGQTFEMLALLPNMYIRVPHQGWYVLSGEALGFSPASLNGYIENRGLFDYEAQAHALAGIVQLPDEEIDGAPYLHYRANHDFQALRPALPSDLFNPSVNAQLQSVTGPVQVDLWLDKETKLPRRHTVMMELQAGGQTITMDMRMAISEYNGDVAIPEAPADARPFDALLEADPPAQID